ncbi:MAG: insulinase family protein [Gammaproteobacteria bacterium]|nr:insulinase family protein [Gammaproteobacteria bacterium]
MKLYLKMLILSLLAVLSGACKDPVHEMTLENGLKVIVQEDHRSPVVVSQIWYKIGAIDEPEGLTGISHVLEHMMFKGTKRYGPGEFSRIIAENGGRENAFTGSDYTAYFQQLEKSRLPIAFELEADRMHNLVLREQDFQKERDVVIEERRLRTEDSPQSLTYEKFMTTAYSVHPYKDPIIGWMKDLEALELADLKEWYGKWYAPNNATLVVVGDVLPREVFALAEKYFGEIKPRAVQKRNLPIEPAQTEPRYSEVSVPAEIPYLLLGYHVPNASSDKNDWKTPALTILAGVLDGGTSSRFTRDIVRGQQLATSVGADYSSVARAPTLFLFDGTPARGHTVSELEQAIYQQIEKVKTSLVDEDELDRVKAQVVAGDVFGRDSVFYQAMRIGQLETVGLDHRLLKDYVKRLQSVTAEQVREVAREYLVKTNLTRTVLNPLPINKKSANAAGKGGGHGAH